MLGNAPSHFVRRFPSGRALLEKAALAISDLSTDGGYLLPDQAKMFMRLMTKQAVLLPQVHLRPMKSHSEEVSQIKFGSRIMRPGVEATALSSGDQRAGRYRKDKDADCHA